MVVGHGLGLHALGGIDQQHGALTSGQRTRNLVREVHVTGRIHQVDLVQISILGRVGHGDRMALDGDAALLFQIHRVEVLLGEHALRHRVGVFQQAVGQRGFAMIDVGNDAEITSKRDVHAGRQMRVPPERDNDVVEVC